MNDDFNTPILIAHLFDGVKIINSIKKGTLKINSEDLKKLQSIFKTFIIEILGLKPFKEKTNSKEKINEIMKLILELRSNAKKSQDWESADLIREKLKKAGIEIKDNRDGTEWEIN